MVEIMTNLGLDVTVLVPLPESLTVWQDDIDFQTCLHCLITNECWVDLLSPLFDVKILIYLCTFSTTIHKP